VEDQLIDLMKIIAGIGVVGFGGLGTVFTKINRNFIDLIKLDQRSREEHTKALTRLHSSLDEFNHINGSKQAECDRIREEMTRQIDRLKEASK